MIAAAVKEPFCAGSLTVDDWTAVEVSDGFFSCVFGRSFLISFFDSWIGTAGAGFSTSGAAFMFSFSAGDSGRLGAGVELAVASMAVDFLVFFFRPMIGAWTGSSGTTFSTISSTFILSSITFARACLSFFCWLFVVCLTGATPTLLGGGELARDMDVEVIDALSDIRSATGVAGRLIEARLGCLDGSLLVPTGLAAAGGRAEVGAVDGVSVFGIGRTRNVLGPADTDVGTVLADDSVAVDAELAGPACTSFKLSVAAEILSFPGSCRFMLS